MSTHTMDTDAKATVTEARLAYARARLAYIKANTTDGAAYAIVKATGVRADAALAVFAATLCSAAI